MIKAYCDVCGNELDSKTFRFEATIDEIVVDLSQDLPMPQKQAKKTILHACDSCYKAKIKNLFQSNDGEKNDNKKEGK